MIYEWWIFHHLCHEVLERRWVERWSQLQVHPSEPLRALRRSKPRGSARRVLTKTSKISTDAQYMSLKIVCFRWFQKFSINAFLKKHQNSFDNFKLSFFQGHTWAIHIRLRPNLPVAPLLPASAQIQQGIYTVLQSAVHQVPICGGGCNNMSYEW